jgi:hypothetical protein
MGVAKAATHFATSAINLHWRISVQKDTHTLITAHVYIVMYGVGCLQLEFKFFLHDSQRSKQSSKVRDWMALWKRNDEGHPRFLINGRTSSETLVRVGISWKSMQYHLHHSSYHCQRDGRCAGPLNSRNHCCRFRESTNQRNGHDCGWSSAEPFVIVKPCGLTNR